MQKGGEIHGMGRYAIVIPPAFDMRGTSRVVYLAPLFDTTRAKSNKKPDILSVPYTRVRNSINCLLITY